MLVEGALDAAGVDRSRADRRPGAARHARRHAFGRRAGARVAFDDATGRLVGVDVRLAAGDPLDETVLRSYALGAVHMALGWVLTESIAVDPETGEVHDLTIRSFGIIRARDMPPVSIAILDDAGRRARGRRTRFSPRSPRQPGTRSTRAEGARPDTFPARDTARVATAPEVVMPVTPVPTPSAPPSPVRTHLRCAPATGSCSPARSASIPRRASWPTASKRRPDRCSPTSRPCSATAARRCRTSRRPWCSSPTSATSRP